MRNLLITLLLLITPTIYAADSGDSIDQFFKHYLDGYNTYLTTNENPDITLVTQHFHEPALQIPPRGIPTNAANHEELGKGFSFFLNTLKQNNVAKLEWEKIESIHLDDNHVLSSIIVRALDAQGSLVERRSSVYSIFRAPEGWKIAMIQPHPVENAPAFN